MPQANAGRLRAIAVTSEKRSTLAPELPTLAESGLPGYSSVTWFGVYLPAGASPALVEKVHKAFVKAVRGIDAGTIHLRINSPGGSVFAARAMEQALREHKARIVVHIDGIAASAATFIAMAGDEIVMNKGAMFMIHKAWTWTAGNADDLAKEAGLLAKIDGTLAQTYADRTGKDVETINGWMADETWFTADEAVEYGFADKLAETEARAEWNLSAYAHAPAMPAARRDDPVPDPDPETTLSDDHRARQMQRVQIAARL